MWYSQAAACKLLSQSLCYPGSTLIFVINFILEFSHVGKEYTKNMSQTDMPWGVSILFINIPAAISPSLSVLAGSVHNQPYLATYSLYPVRHAGYDCRYLCL